MRKELENIEYITQYIKGTLNEQQVAHFQQLLSTDILFKKEYETQLLIHQAANRMAIKADIAKYGGSNLFGPMGKWLLGLGLLAVLVASLWYFIPSAEDSKFNDTVTQANVEKELIPHSNSINEDTITNHHVINVNQQDTSYEAVVWENKNENEAHDEVSDEKVIDSAEDKIKYESNGRYELDGLKTWVEPEIQRYKISPDEGATIVADDGTLIIVPTDAFIYGNGELVSEKVELEVIEALTVSDMLTHNLTTLNNDKALTSGGMLYIQPKVKNKKVNINPKRPLYIEIPTDDYNPAMMTWKGDVDKSGNINWTDPKPLEKFLTIVNFENLDFLPNGFREAVEAGIPFKNYKNANDKLVDSLYYSFCSDLDSNVEVKKDDLAEINNSDGKRRRKFSFSIGARKGLRELLKTYYLRGSIVLTGNVQDIYGTRIGNAIVSISQNNLTNKDMIFTDSRGNFKFNKLEEGQFTIAVSKGELYLQESFTTVPNSDVFQLQQPLILRKLVVDTSQNNGISSSNLLKYASQSGNSVTKNKILKEEETCFINPQSVKTIKTETFSQTFLATKEFEQRIKILHQLDNAQELFDLYVNNLSKNLYEVDEMVANQIQKKYHKDIFLDFAAQKLTNVKNDNIYQDKLFAYYNAAKAENIKQARSARKAYSSLQQAELDVIKQQITKAKNDFYKSDAYKDKALMANNSANTSKQGRTRLGLNLPNLPKIGKNPVNVTTSSNTYSTTWYSSGWMNIDAYLHELSNGSKKVSIAINQNGGRIYQCLNTLKTILPLNANKKNIATAKFPTKGKASVEMRNTFTIGIARLGNKIFLSKKKYNPYQNDQIDLDWTEVTEKELIVELKQLDHTGPLINELKAQTAQIKKQEAYLAKQKEINAAYNEAKQMMEKEVDSLTTQLKAKLELQEKERAFMMSLLKVINKCGIEKDFKVEELVKPAIKVQIQSNELEEKSHSTAP